MQENVKFLLDHLEILYKQCFCLQCRIRQRGAGGSRLKVQFQIMDCNDNGYSTSFLTLSYPCFGCLAVTFPGQAAQPGEQ